MRLKFATRQLMMFWFLLEFVALATLRVKAQTFEVIYSFTAGSDGGRPLAGLAIDTNGILYGTASIGGSFGSGVVFKSSEAGQETAIYSFGGGTDGANPEAAPLVDAKGDIYGTTYNGGGSTICNGGCGTIFKIDAVGNETVLYRFSGGTDGGNPEASLTMDQSGNLYGTTFEGGVYGYGTVFELSSSGQETVLYSFTGGSDGANPVGGVTLVKGEVFGTTSLGGDLTCLNPNGTYGCGTVFQLVSPTSHRATTWRETVLHSFGMQDDGGIPYAGLVFSNSRHLYGAATSGGSGGGGTVFELSPSKSGWNFSVLYGIPGWSISGTFANVVLDSSGNVYATTHCDGTLEDGTIYEISPSVGGWTFSLLYNFCSEQNCSDGLYSYSNLVFDKQGNLYGTTYLGGANLYDGEIFKLTP